MAFKVSKKFQDMIDRNTKISADAKAVEDKWKAWTPPSRPTQTNNISQNTAPKPQQDTFQKKELPKFDFSSVGNFLNSADARLNNDPYLPKFNYSSIGNFAKSASERFNYTPEQQTTNNQNWLDRWTEQTRQNLKGNLQDNLITATYNKLAGNKPPTYVNPNIDYNTGIAGDVSSGLLGMATDPLTYVGAGVASKAGKAIKGSANFAKAGNLSKFLVPLAGEGAAFGATLGAGNELKNTINDSSQFNLGSSIGKTIGGALEGAAGNVVLGSAFKGIGKGASTLNKKIGKLATTESKIVYPGYEYNPFLLNAPPEQKLLGRYAQVPSPFTEMKPTIAGPTKYATLPQPEPQFGLPTPRPIREAPVNILPTGENPLTPGERIFKGNFTVNNDRVAIQAQQELEDAIITIQNHFGTNKIMPDEIARVKSELGIDLAQLIARVENPVVDVRAIGERAKFAQIGDINNVMARPDQSLYNLKYPRNLVANPRQLKPSVPPESTTPPSVLDQFKKDIFKKKIPLDNVPPVTNIPINNMSPSKFQDTRNLPIKPIVKPNKTSIPNIPVDNFQSSTGLNAANLEANRAKVDSIVKNMVRNKEAGIPQNTPPVLPNAIPNQVNNFIEIPNAIPKQTIKSTPLNQPQPNETMSNADNISKFRTNTLERYTKITPEERAQLNPENYSFIRETNKQWQDGAAASIEKDIDEVMSRLSKQESLTGGIDAAEGALIGEKLLQKARETGNPLDMAEYRKWTEIIAEKTRETARAFKATDFSYDKSTPAGAIQKAQGAIDKLIPQELHTKINSEAKKIKFEIKKIDNEAFEQIAKEFEEIINPSKFQATGNLPKDFKYEMAKEISPQFLSNKELPDKNLDRFIKTNLKELGVDVGKLVRDFNQQDAINDITRYMIKNSGLSEPEATALANQIKTRLSQITADKKQQIINNMFKEKKASIPKTEFEKIMELINLGAYDDMTIRDLIKKRDNLPMLDTEDINKIYDLVEKANKIANKNSYEYKLEMGRVSNIIEDKMPATWKDYYMTARYVAMLGNLVTGTRNVIGNAALMPFEGVKNTIMAPLDKLISLKTGKRTTFVPTLKSNKILLKGIGKGVKETYYDLKYGVNTNPTPGQFEINKKKLFKKIPVLNQLEKGVNFMMSIGDRPFYQGIHDKSSYQIMNHNKTNTLTPEMTEYATKIAKDATYVNDSSIAKKAQEIKSGMGPVGDIVMPFVRTPANIADKILDYLPTGFAKAAFELGKGSNNKIAKEFYKGLYKDPKNLEFDQKKFIDRLGRAIEGSGVIAGSSALASSGKITGSENKNKTLSTIERQAGKLPFAIKNGDNYTTYDWAQPISTLIATGANLGDSKMSKKDAMLASTKLLQNQSFLRGLNDLFSSGNIATGLYNSLVKAPGQFNPTLVKQATKFNDPYVREKSGEPKISALGKPVLQKYGNNTFLNNFINPASTATYNPTKSEKLIIDLANKTGDTKFLPTQQDESFKVDGKEVTLTPEQLTKFRKNIGLNLDKVYNQLANNKTFIQSNDKDKITILNNFKNKIVSDAKDNIMDNKNKMPIYDKEAISKKQFEMIKDEIYKNIDKKYKLNKNQSGKIIKDYNYDKNTKAKDNIQDRISPKKTNNMSEQQKLELIKQLRKGSGY